MTFQASQPLDDVAFMGGSGEELEIPEESVLDLQNLKVMDQGQREGSCDFLDVDGMRLSPLPEHIERKKHKIKSRVSFLFYDNV